MKVLIFLCILCLIMLGIYTDFEAKRYYVEDEDSDEDEEE